MSFQNNIRHLTLPAASLMLLPLTNEAQQLQEGKHTITIQAKEWSKDQNKQVHYSDWKNFEATTINQLDGFISSKSIAEDRYGGYGEKTKVTGFFYTKKIEDRWWVINPEGRRTVIRAVNSIRLNKPGEVPTSFGSINDWSKTTFDQLKEFGFNVAGCWSDTASILTYNKTASKPIVYTTQLSLLSSYVSKTKKEHPERKSESSLSFLLDDEFAAYCDSKAATIAYLKNDPNLLGHFSDNELLFTHNELKEILSDKNTEDKAYKMLVGSYMQSGDIISPDQKLKFLAYFANRYYQIASAAIKKYDPNHLYIGSRLHSNAKSNQYIFKAAEQYLDIVSINYYGAWQPEANHLTDWLNWCDKPFFITEFYTKAEETGMANLSGAGWIVKTQNDRGIHYQNFCLELLKAKNCVGWHWFRYQDNDPNDAKADDSNKDSNKGIYNINYQPYGVLVDMMKPINQQTYQLIKYFDSKQK